MISEIYGHSYGNQSIDLHCKPVIDLQARKLPKSFRFLKVFWPEISESSSFFTLEEVLNFSQYWLI